MSEDWSVYRLVVIKGMEKIETEIDRLRKEGATKEELESLAEDVKEIQEQLEDAALERNDQKWLNRLMLIGWGAGGSALWESIINFFKGIK